MSWHAERDDLCLARHVAVYDYDLLNRLKLKTYENTKTVAYTYYDDNLLLSLTDQNGSVFSYGYDDAGNRTGCSISLGSGVYGDDDESWGYDALNRMIFAMDDDSRVEYTYDSLSRVITEKQGNHTFGAEAKTVTFEHNPESQVEQIAYPSGFEANYGRDDAGMLMSVTDGTPTSIAAFEMVGMHRIVKTTFGNGTTTNYAYDGFRRPENIAHKDSTPTEFAGFTYGWDDNDNPLFEARSHQAGHGDVYTYDKANRLTRAKIDVDDPAAEAATPNSEVYVSKLDYSMDDVFNLLTYTETPYTGPATVDLSYAPNAMNEYATINDNIAPATQTLGYTDNGALEDDENFFYVYDAHDHLIEVRESASHSNVVAIYTYDAVGRGRRTKKDVTGGAITRFIYADQQSIEELDGSNVLVRLFVFGDRIDQVLMMEAADVADVDGDTDAGELKRFYYHTQLIGSVTHVTDPDEQVVESYEYDPYGKPTIHDQGLVVVGASPIGNPYLFTGRQFDEESGLYYHRARLYSHSLRRFIQRDPLEYVDSPNAYAYVSSSPVSSVDRSGLSAEDDKKVADIANAINDYISSIEDNMFVDHMKNLLEGRKGIKWTGVPKLKDGSGGASDFSKELPGGGIIIVLGPVAREESDPMSACCTARVRAARVIGSVLHEMEHLKAYGNEKDANSTAAAVLHAMASKMKAEGEGEESSLAPACPKKCGCKFSAFLDAEADVREKATKHE